MFCNNISYGFWRTRWLGKNSSRGVLEQSADWGKTKTLGSMVEIYGNISQSMLDKIKRRWDIEDGI